MKLKVGRVGDNSLTITGESAFQSPQAATPNTFATSVPARAGDVIGFYHVGSNFADCAATGQTGYTDVFTQGDILPGATGSPITSEPGGHLDIAAVLESDCDADGRGDESQDPDIASCGPLTCKGQQATHVGTTGNDEIRGTRGRDVIAALTGKDKTFGLAGKDLVCGGAGRDTLNGGKGKDKLLGQKGADTLKGGGGNDTCKGGQGRDLEKSC